MNREDENDSDSVGLTEGKLMGTSLMEQVKGDTGVWQRASARYGIDVRGFRLHREAHDLDAVFATLDGIDGRISIIDRHTNSVFFGTADEIRQRLAGTFPLDGKDRA